MGLGVGLGRERVVSHWILTSCQPHRIKGREREWGGERERERERERESMQNHRKTSKLRAKPEPNCRFKTIYCRSVTEVFRYNRGSAKDP